MTTADEPNMKTIAKAEVPGLTKAQTSIQIVALLAVSIITVWTLYMVPSWQVPGDPFLLAAVVGTVTVACLWLARWLGSRAIRFERTMLAGFLVAMPLVYVMGWFAARDHAASSWIWVELLGIGALCCFRCTRFKELALVPCHRNRRPWIRMGSLALQELGLYPGLVRICMHARGLSARCLCGRAYRPAQARKGAASMKGTLEGIAARGLFKRSTVVVTKSSPVSGWMTKSS